MKTFESLGLSEPVLKVLAEIGFEQPSEIQAEAIPVLLTEFIDFIGQAQTGTGKTAAFGLPLIEKVEVESRHTQALVLAPTRELCQQIAEQLQTFSKYVKGLNVLPVFGGANIGQQIKALKKPTQIIVATPGRLIDLIKRKALYLDELSCLILDEADEMLNMGFKDELDEILSYTPEDKLVWLFSATLPAGIKKIISNYMDDPFEVRVSAKNEMNKNIEHQFVSVKNADKIEALSRFLDIHEDMRALIFCRTRRETKNLADILKARNYKTEALHGDLNQNQRDHVMKRFKNHQLEVVIATDVAARGIDVNDLSHVFHMTLPDDMAYYTHRSGRTARAGKHGVSIAFVNRKEQFKIRQLEKKLKINFEKIAVPAVALIAENRMQHFGVRLLQQKTKGFVSDTLLEQMNMLFANLSKEELIAKVVSRELSKLNLNADKEIKEDLSEGKGKKDRKSKERRKDKNGKSNRSERSDRSDRRDRSERKDRRSKDSKPRDGKKNSKNNQSPRYFINLGKRDKLDKKDLVDLMSSLAGLKKKDIGKIDILKSYSFFEVDRDAAHKIKASLNKITLDDGRKLRVNRDN